MLFSQKKLLSLEQVRIIDLPRYSDNIGELVVIEELSSIPFKIVRVFTVIASAGSIRGQHAHKQCSQFLTCPKGVVEVLCYDGNHKLKYVLDRPDIGILLPRTIWSEQKYLSDHSVLNVFCDYNYVSEDYIRDYELFEKYRNEKSE